MVDILQLTNLSTAYLQSFFLTLTRISVIVATSPLFGSRTVPALAKASLAVLLSVVVLPLNTQGLTPVSEDVFGLVLALAREVLLGALVGFSSAMMFTAMQMAAHLAGLQMGFAFANVLDPMNQNQISLLDQLYSMLTVLVFLAINGHHLLIMAIQRTFEIVPLNTFALSSVMVDKIVVLASQLLVISARIALPILAALLLADVSLGIIARVVPQLNVFFLGLPLKVGLGLVMLALVLPMTIGAIEQLLNRSMSDVFTLLRLAS